MVKVDWADDRPGPVHFPEPWTPPVPTGPEVETETVEIRLRMTFERLPGVTSPTAEIAADLAAQCVDMLNYQHKDNEDAYCASHGVEIIG